jgi:hypothetical protein
MKSLLVPLHFTLYAHHRPSALQLASTHPPLHVTHEQLILKSCDRLLERPMLTLQAAISVDFRDERTVTDLTERLIYTVVPHLVSV